MFLELVATFAAGFAGAGLILIINKALGGRLPRWLMPVAAGCAMLAATISSEYGWYDRTVEAVTEDAPELVVVQTVESKRAYRPWTYFYPYIDRFVAVDTASIRNHEAQPNLRLADTYFFGRWSPVNKIGVLTDCANGRRAALIDAISFNDDGTVSGAAWVTAPDEDPVLTKICEG